MRVPALAERAKLAASRARCPGLDGYLHGVTLNANHIDVCLACHGIWLDAGELVGLRRRRPASEPGTTPRPPGKPFELPIHEVLEDLVNAIAEAFSRE